MNISDYIYLINLQNIVTLLTLIVLLIIIRYLWRGFLTSTALGTYVIVTDEGFKKVLTKGHHFIWHPREKVFRGRFAPTLCYKVFAPNVPRRRYNSHNLLNRRTGRVNLKIQQLTCPEFHVSTSEPKERRLTANISFQLDRDILENALTYEDFGATLQARIEEAFRETIGLYGDQDIGINKAQVIRQVTHFLMAPENNARKKKGLPEVPILKKGDEMVANSAERTPLGVRFIDVGFYMPSGRKKPPEDENIKPGREINIRHMEDIDQENLDSIRDQFLIDNWEKSEWIKDKEAHYQTANEIMLRILELQSDQNTARALVDSGSLMILSSGEMGIRGQLLREPMRKFMQEFSKAKDK
ncbi:MAG: hypothetical protein ACRBBN_09915 [Methyloligellaceae bacterium]